MENISQFNGLNVNPLSLEALLNDRSPMPEDLIAPNILTPGGLLVFGGEPKVGKSDFLLTLLVHMASGTPFLGMTPPRPLRIFYLQAELRYDYLRERVQRMAVDESWLPLLGKNLLITSEPNPLLNAKGIQLLQGTLTHDFSEGPVDIIVTDPLHYFFDWQEEGVNKSYSDIISAVQQRLSHLRNMLNPNAGLIVTHSIYEPQRGKNKDPFSGMKEMGNLRRRYTSMMVMVRPNKKETGLQITFKRRNSPQLGTKHVDKIDNQWCEINACSKPSPDLGDLK